jgi:hypothetical protein
MVQAACSANPPGLTALLDGVDFDGFVKFFAEIVREIENFRNFVLG